MRNFRKISAQQGFTFIEVLVAMLIFTLTVIAAIDIAKGSVRATQQAKKISTATFLVQNIMAELESTVESAGIERGCQEEQKGQFEAPYEGFAWATYCYQVDFRISEAAAQMAQAAAEGEDASISENQVLRTILTMASKYITDSMRELHSEVTWMEGNTEQRVSLTTHIGRFDLPAPNLAAPTTSQSGGATD